VHQGADGLDGVLQVPGLVPSPLHELPVPLHHLPVRRSQQYQPRQEDRRRRHGRRREPQAAVVAQGQLRETMRLAPDLLRLRVVLAVVLREALHERELRGPAEAVVERGEQHALRVEHATRRGRVPAALRELPGANPPLPADGALVFVLRRDVERRRSKEAEPGVGDVGEAARREEPVEVGDRAVERAGNQAEVAGDPAHPADEGGARVGQHPAALRRVEVVGRGPLPGALLLGPERHGRLEARRRRQLGPEAERVSLHRVRHGRDATWEGDIVKLPGDGAHNLRRVPAVEQTRAGWRGRCMVVEPEAVGAGVACRRVRGGAGVPAGGTTVAVVGRRVVSRMLGEAPVQAHVRGGATVSGSGQGPQGERARAGASKTITEGVHRLRERASGGTVPHCWGDLPAYLCRRRCRSRLSLVSDSKPPEFRVGV
jgi:hypothetical protein